MTISIPLNWFTAISVWLLMLYIMPRIGAREHAGWLFSKRSLAVFALAIMLFCVGLDAFGVARLFSFMFKGG